jgi:hypothetical protein
VTGDLSIVLREEPKTHQSNLEKKHYKLPVPSQFQLSTFNDWLSTLPDLAIPADQPRHRRRRIVSHRSLVTALNT